MGSIITDNPPIQHKIVIPMYTESPTASMRQMELHSDKVSNAPKRFGGDKDWTSSVDISIDSQDFEDSSEDSEIIGGAFDEKENSWQQPEVESITTDNPSALWRQMEIISDNLTDVLKRLGEYLFLF